MTTDQAAGVAARETSPSIGSVSDLDTKPGARTSECSYFNVLLRVPTRDAPGYSVGDDILTYGMWELWNPSGQDDGRTPTAYAVTRLANASHFAHLVAPAHDS